MADDDEALMRMGGWYDTLRAGMASPDTVKIGAKFLHMSATGKLLRLDVGKGKEVWLPAALVRSQSLGDGDIFVADVPAWWAARPGFLLAAPHPNPLPAGGEREKKKTAGE